ncbi:hypothetical protein [Halorubrum sp. DTA46]|uniref:hypothetical protein n=1 Tax=Halorubrum sp. DTA46 TaxID=3402162 RepID=UPI003AAEEA83
MSDAPTGRRAIAAAAGLTGLGLVVLPVALGPVQMWSIAAASIGVLLVVVAVVLAVGSPPPERDLHQRGF